MRLAGIIAIAVLISLVTGSVFAQAADTEAIASATLDKLLTAVQNNDYDAFVEDGTPQVKAGMTKQMLTGVHLQMKPKMNSGYKVEYLGALKQTGLDIYLYKLTYGDSSDDTLAKLVLDAQGKVAGFWLQ